ncbi:GDP-mannose 4,6 dehydratase [Rhizoctonia solani]|uniref:GDP-mannose 4,6 dehydratase n=1 Tax=Rhizoctonia solani TaxID=456999 RepID=A0A8H7I0Z0_9AGAM|nr:GDP-mannose 4,6 dehydratase [Rhizoctonia solani]
MNDGAQIQSSALNIVVVTGGNGFIGSHVAKHYFDLGYHVRVIDIVPFSKHDDIPFYTERSIGDLCDLHFCENAFRGAQIVFHFGAVMGGMGVIHPDNDSIIYRANHTITQNVLNAASLSGVQSFFYASSACVYPTSLQADQGSCDVSLRESDAYPPSGPQPQHLYGLEKLNSEHIVLQFANRMSVRIGRFHNVYGPRGSWNDGHEKVPAAFIRKALAAKRLRRSFLYIDDAVRAIALMMDAEGHISLSLVGLEPSDVEFVREERPVGVASRNSNNDLVSTVISWKPRITHRDGLGRTLKWIETQVDLGAPSDPDHIIQYLQSLTSSRMVDLEKDHLIKFALLLPITSRPDPEACIRNLDVFARSLETTSWRDRNQICSTRFEPYIYLAIDDDDDYLLPSPEIPTALPSRSSGPRLSQDLHHRLSSPKGTRLRTVGDTARLAYEHTCDYYVLMGDDIELLDEGWMRTIHQRFQTLSDESGGPPGFGCVAFTDITFPGMPTFPVVHRTHMDIFNGHVVPEEFINQDGDPYLFQMYRHFGASTTVPSGYTTRWRSDDARYEKQHLSNWTFEPLENGKTRIREWAALHAPRVEQKMSLDVIVPSYRVELETSPEDIRSQAESDLNRGLTESSAEWVAFLDDDVDPSPNYLVAAEKYIRQHPNAAGFVGNAISPEQDCSRRSLGVTANLIVRRNIRDDVTFDLIFPKTGGGEDIDYCRKKRRASLDRGGPHFGLLPRRVSYILGGTEEKVVLEVLHVVQGGCAELFALSALVVLPGMAARNRNIIQFGLVLAFTTLIINILHDAHRHLIRHKDRTTSIKATIGPVSW